MNTFADAVASYVFPWWAEAERKDIPARMAGSREDDTASPRPAAEDHATEDHATEDHATVAGLRAGDSATYDRIFRAHYPMLVGFAASLLDDRERAEEVVGDVFVWIYEHRSALEVSGSLRGYLFGAVRHAALNARRARDREQARYDRMSDADAELITPVRALLPDEALVAAESGVGARDVITRALDQLPPQARLILALRIHRGLDYDEIARALGVSRVAAKQRFSRAVAALRTLMPDLLE